MATRNKHTPEYRRGAACVVIDTDRSIVGVARKLHLGPALLGWWVKKERERTGEVTGPASAELSVDERSELDRLRKEIAELRLDNEFLGRAAALFASKPRK